MYIEKETEKAYLMVHEAVSFWIQKRWYLKNNKLSKEGWKAFRVAKKEYCKRFGFDALKEFEVVRKTDKAALLRCFIVRLNGEKKAIDFWTPLSMINNFGFVSKKVKQIEDDFPFVDAHVLWSGNTEEKECA